MDGVMLVTGGTGTLGRHVVWRLLEDEHEVRVLSRRGRPEGDRTPTEWAKGDLISGGGLAAALVGVRVIMHCATTGGRKDVMATRNLVQAAKRASNPHLVYVSIVGVDRVPMFYYRAKLECERIIAESGLPWTTLRTTQFHDLIVRLVSAQRLLPVVVTLGGDARIQPVEAREVAERVVELAVGEPAGRVADMGGPQVRTIEELTRAVLRARGSRRPVVGLHLPGRAFAAVREGALLAPGHAVGHGTFEGFLALR